MIEEASSSTDEGIESPEGHDEIMGALADRQEHVGTETETVAEAEEPKILDKFNTTEDLATGYKEAQSELTRVKMELAKLKKNPELESPPEETQEQVDSGQQGVEEYLEGKGLDYSSLEQEVATTGQLSLESLAELSKAGISPEVAQTYIQNQNQYVQDMQEEAFSLAGSEENYEAMTVWASESLNEGEKEAFNEAVTSGNQDKARIAIESLAFKYQNQFGKDPDRQLHGKGSFSQAGYQSEGEMIAAMSDPRYQSDAAYRATVAKRVNAGSVFQ